MAYQLKLQSFDQRQIAEIERVLDKYKAAYWRNLREHKLALAALQKNRLRQALERYNKTHTANWRMANAGFLQQIGL